MTHYLVEPDGKWFIPINLDAQAAAALNEQVARCPDENALEWFCERLGYQVAQILPNALDYDLRAPSTAQVDFAMAIARSLGVALPPDVLRYRKDMHAFLEQHAESFKARKGARTPRANRAPLSPGVEDGATYGSTFE